MPVITGDLMDSPSEENLGDVRAFMSFLRNTGIREPAVVLGNHDVRDDGWLNPKLDQAVNISRQPVVMLSENLALACLNSVVGGNIARGKVGDQERSAVGDALDRQLRNNANATVVAALHHHPIPVEIPDWYKKKWYERVLGGWFEKTECLEDSELMNAWFERRGVSAVLHGHKHIPRFDSTLGFAVIGCGSTVGKVHTVTKGQTYMSINIVTIDRARKKLSCRLRAERITGAGLEKSKPHEIALRAEL